MKHSVIISTMAKALSRNSRVLVLSCEHAHNTVPRRYTSLFEHAADVLNTHLGWDPGALQVATHFARLWNAPLFSFPYTRLLIEPNRSLHNPELFSDYSRHLSDTEKDHLIRNYYTPFREQVISFIVQAMHQRKQILHISIHTFTPQLNGVNRNFDLGLLFDPSREMEDHFCSNWGQSLSTRWKTKMNEPYEGIADGFTSWLRHRFPAKWYLGIELEINQLAADAFRQGIVLSDDPLAW